MQLSCEQQKALDLMKAEKNVFITGPAGTGKSEIIHMYRSTRDRRKSIGITSTTGISAVSLKGRTVHSFCGIGTGSADVELLITRILKERSLTYRWRKLDVLVIDEISMLSAELFDKLELIARTVRNNAAPFGGIQIIICGDFLQLPTVSGEFCFKAESWNRVVTDTVYLTEIMRQDNIEFQQCLNDVRLGAITEQVRDLLLNRVGAVLDEGMRGVRPTRLYATNRSVDVLNDVELDKLAEDGREFKRYEIDIVPYPCLKGAQIDTTISKYLHQSTLPEYVEICEGAQVMLLHNLDQPQGLVNGSRGVVTGFVEDYPKVLFCNGTEMVITPVTIEHEDNEKALLRVTQVPLRIAYACTIHKSQGATLDCVELDLSNIFELGQAYVALSRVRDVRGLVIASIAFERIRAHPEALEFYGNLEVLASTKGH